VNFECYYSRRPDDLQSSRPLNILDFPMGENTALLGDMRVLIVEDEPLIAFSVEDEARSLGCSATYIAYHQQQALDAIDAFAPDFAILDVALTNTGTDYTIADALADRNIPFIFSSGHRAGERPERHMARPFVGKPMQSSDFAAAVRMALS
jgi:CheY-like chemotaxis protein